MLHIGTILSWLGNHEKTTPTCVSPSHNTFRLVHTVCGPLVPTEIYTLKMSHKYIVNFLFIFLTAVICKKHLVTVAFIKRYPGQE